MKKIILYNSKTGLFICIIFVICLFYYVGHYECSCHKQHNTLCYRTEFYGVQFNHLFFFIFLGIMFPDFFYTVQIIGIIF